MAHSDTRANVRAQSICSRVPRRACSETPCWFACINCSVDHDLLRADDVRRDTIHLHQTATIDDLSVVRGQLKSNAVGQP